MRVGLQVKSVLALSVLALAATAAGGWLYYVVARNVLHNHDRAQAEGFANGLAVAAGPGLVSGDRETLQKLAIELLNRPNVQSVYILDRDGRTAAVAERVCPDAGRPALASKPVSMSYEVRRAPGFLEMGRPVIASVPGERQEVLAGAVRLVLDTRETAHILAGVRRGTAFIAAAILLCVIPLGYLVVWRVMTVPIRRLMKATRQLAEGDFSARAETCRNDEIGELASSFDMMAEKLNASHQQIRQANESLERKVAERTAELQRANRRLHEEMSEKEDFLRAVSHDLNAPLRNIAGMATMISMKFRDQLPEEVIARLQHIQSNVDAGSDLISELLELSRIRTRPEKRETVDFGQLLRSLRDSLEYELKAKGIALEIGYPMPRLHVDRNRMRQVFQNLIDNAIKYMPDRTDGKIEVGYSQADGMHRFCVADNGPGIAPADQERIFHIFRRTAAATATGVSGKGVGLALVKNVVANYEGRVWVESEAGAGSAFYFSLSARCAAGPDSGAPAEAPASADLVGQTTCNKPEHAAFGSHLVHPTSRGEPSVKDDVNFRDGGPDE